MASYQPHQLSFYFCPLRVNWNNITFVEVQVQRDQLIDVEAAQQRRIQQDQAAYNDRLDQLRGNGIRAQGSDERTVH